MAFEAKRMYPEIDFEKSLIIGDSISDMEFGKNAGMYSVWLSEKEQKEEHKSLIDAQTHSLLEFAKLLETEAKQEA